MKITFSKMIQTDLDFFVSVRNECRMFLHDNRSFTIDEVRKWFKSSNSTYYIIRLDGRRIGYFRLSNHNPINQTIYIGADLHKDFRGRGLGELCYRKFMRKLAKQLSIRKFYLEVLSSNRRALCLYLKLGFIIEGVKQKDVLTGGKYIDSILMGYML